MSEMKHTPKQSARDIATTLKAEGIRCNCDLDKWQPEPSTGHSCVCRIHKTATERFRFPAAPGEQHV